MSLIPPTFLDKVVALGTPDKDGNIRYAASGFLYGQPSGNRGRYYVYLVTNRHVVKGIRSPQIRFNALAGTAPKILPLPPNDSGPNDHWIFHPDSDVDVAVLLIDSLGQALEDVKMAFFTGNAQTERLDSMKSGSVSEGDEVYVLGFPLGLAGAEQNYVIVRQGVIARIQDCYERRSKEFLIDSFVFPGNSGGPVILKPTMFSYGQTRPDPKLIGVVAAYQPFVDVALSEQTGTPRLIVQENSGLATVIPVDLIQETVGLAAEKYGITQPSPSVIPA